MADAQNLRVNNGLGLNRASIANSNFALDQTTDQLEFIFQADEAATITKLGYRYGARTGTPPTYQISLQGVDASGNPDGTIKASGNAKATFTPPADASIDGLVQYQTLTNSYTCTRGEYLAIVIAYSSGTVNGSNFSSFTSTYGGSLSSNQAGLPYAIQNDATVRTRQTNDPVFAYGSASKIYGQPVQSLTTYTLTQASTPDEVAMAFTLPTGWTGSYQIEGVAVFCALIAAKTIKVQLYSGTTVLQSVTHDTDAFQVSGGNRLVYFLFQDATLTTLAPGVVYRIGFQPQDAAGNEIFYAWAQGSAADWSAYPLGTNWYLSTRTDLGAWSDVTTERLEGMLLFRDITAPSPGIIVAT